MRSDELTDMFDNVNSLHYKLSNLKEVGISLKEVKLIKSQLSGEFSRYSHLLPKLNKVNKQGVELISKGVKNNMNRIKLHLYKVNEIIEVMKQKEEC